MDTIIDILKESGYSDKAIKFYLGRVNVGEIANPSIHHASTGPNGDTIEIYLTIKSNIILEAKFQAIGCAGIFSSGSAITKMIVGLTIEQALLIHVEDIVEYLDGVPDEKIECALLAKNVLREAISHYQAI